MKVKALVSFSGLVSMASGDVAEINDSAIAEDLIKAGYVVSLEAEKPKKKAPAKKGAKKNDVD